MTTTALPVHGNRACSLFILGDAPMGVERGQRPFSASAAQPFLIALHRYGQSFADCAATYLLDKPLQEYRGYEAEHFTTVRSTAVESGFIETPGGFASATLLERRQALLTLLDEIRPSAVLTTGELALWALTSETKVATVRGSVYRSVELPSGHRVKVVCTLSPADLNAQPHLRDAVSRDIARAVSESRTPVWLEPERDFLTQGTFDTFQEALIALRTQLDQSPQGLPLACDIETLRHQIECVGFATSATRAICVPFRTSFEYWSIDQELELIGLIRDILEHRNARVIGQNFHYDAQYFGSKWGIVPRFADDTMVAQHLLFLGMPKTLYFIASVYCDWYQYWKDDLKDYRKAPEDDQKFFRYNCLDCCYTFEAMEKLNILIDRNGMRQQYTERTTRLWWTVLRMTLRGMRVDTKMRSRLSIELFHAATARQEFLDYVIGRPFNSKSTPQMKHFFYEEMGVKPQKSRITKKPSLGAEILAKLHEDYPILGPVADTIIELRSIGVFRKTFVEAPIDADARVRSFFGMCGTETLRFSSSENAFGTGMNLQNLPKGDRARTSLKMPNIREMYLPDPGYEVFDIDLAGADAMVVAWEAEETSMKELFASKKKIAAFAAREIFGSAAGADGKNEPYYTRAKMAGHACVDGQHEVLTMWGWKSVKDVQDWEPILVCEKDGSRARFEVPSAWFRKQTTTDMVKLDGAAYSQFVTSDHKIAYYNGHSFVETRAGLLPSSARLQKTCQYSGPLTSVDPLYLRLLCAFHADGSIEETAVRFHFKKERKVQRLQLILTALGLRYSINPTNAGGWKIRIAKDSASWLISRGKKPTWDMLQYGAAQLDAYIDELVFWDGHAAETSQTFFTADCGTASVVQTLLHLRGKAGSILEATRSYRVQINNRPLSRVTATLVQNWTGVVYCPTVSTGYWFTRRDGRMAVTGNTNYGAWPGTVAKACGISMRDAEHFQQKWFEIFPGIKKWHERIEYELQTRRAVQNKFGYTKRFFGRIDGALPEALAWVPQSTVAIVATKAMDILDLNFPLARLYLQVHDSLVFGLPLSRPVGYVQEILDAVLIPIPYDSPLIIPWGTKSSVNNWGQCG